ncbi:MAG TPA: isoprenylcysteine carboxylmethyltransferase family protein, partial [Candidatus Acidoferrum sp.]
MDDLTRKTAVGLGRFVVSLLALVFLPAWSLRYWQGWLFVVVFGGVAVAISVYLLKHDPQLLAKRLKAGPEAEKERSQKIIQALASAGFVALMVVPAVDHRLGWSRVPVWLVIAGDCLIAAGYAIVFFVFRENSFTSSTVEIQEGQRVVSSGPYTVVRHPMYSGGLVLLAGVPLALGSWWAMLLLIPFAAL